MAGPPPTTGEERIAANVETWRILKGTTLPFDADAARRHVEASIARARDFGAATQHDLAGRQMTAERQALLLVAHGEALAGLIPGARFERAAGMGHGFFSPDIPALIGGLILE